MAAYSSGINDPLKLSTLLSVLDGDLPIDYTNSTSGSSNSTTVTSWTDLIRVTETNLTTDELMLCMFTTSLSNSASTNRTELRFEIGGSAVNPVGYFTHNNSSTAGREAMLTIFALAVNLSGSNDVAVEWQVTAGTSYSQSYNLAVMRMKRK